MTTQNLSLYNQQAEIAQTETQYSLAKILGIWAVVALPMALLAWVVTPALIPHVDLHPGILFWLMMIVGLVWQFVLSLVILYRELGTLRWSAVRHRTWLNMPRSPQTNEPQAKLFWWLVPCLVVSALVDLAIGEFLNAPLTWLFPLLAEPAYADMSGLVSPEFVGKWWLVGIVLISCLFNYFLGEELLFRGVLLPRMRGAFGKWDWVANAALFGLYHLHKPWMIPSIAVSSLATVWPARRFRCNWMAVIIHGVEGIFLLVVVLGVVMGLA